MFHASFPLSVAKIVVHVSGLLCDFQGSSDFCSTNQKINKKLEASKRSSLP